MLFHLFSKKQKKHLIIKLSLSFKLNVSLIIKFINILLQYYFIAEIIKIIISVTTYPGDGMVREYCQGEEFKASCVQGEVITMTASMYGSMKIGRCLDDDYGDLGCAADVIRTTDKLCSGKRECQIIVPNKDMDLQRKCPKDPWRYLEASYQCRKGKTTSQSLAT